MHALQSSNEYEGMKAKKNKEGFELMKERAYELESLGECRAPCNSSIYVVNVSYNLLVIRVVYNPFLSSPLINSNNNLNANVSFNTTMITSSTTLISSTSNTSTASELEMYRLSPSPPLLLGSMHESSQPLTSQTSITMNKTTTTKHSYQNVISPSKGKSISLASNKLIRSCSFLITITDKFPEIKAKIVCEDIDAINNRDDDYIDQQGNTTLEMDKNGGFGWMSHYDLDVLIHSVYRLLLHHPNGKEPKSSIQRSASVVALDFHFGHVNYSNNSNSMNNNNQNNNSSKNYEENLSNGLLYQTILSSNSKQTTAHRRVDSDRHLRVLSGSSDDQGPRDKMEDALTAVDRVRIPLTSKASSDSDSSIVQPLRDTVTCSFHAVYDGHGGSLASQMSAKNLHTSFFKAIKKGNGFRQALWKACMETEKKLSDMHLNEKSRGDDGITESVGGTTACIIAIDFFPTAVSFVPIEVDDINNGKHSSLSMSSSNSSWVMQKQHMKEEVIRLPPRLYCANVGDSRAVLGKRGGIPFELSSDQRADNPEEIARIAANSGFVAHGRVMGMLAVARAIGDMELKELGSGIVSAHPEIISRTLKEDEDEFIVIACDGVWDVMSSYDVIAFVHDSLMVKKRSPEEAAQELVQHVVHVRRSLDNVSAIVIVLDWQNESAQSNTSSSSSSTALAMGSTSASVTTTTISPSTLQNKKTPPPSSDNQKHHQQQQQQQQPKQYKQQQQQQLQVQLAKKDDGIKAKEKEKTSTTKLVTSSSGKKFMITTTVVPSKEETKSKPIRALREASKDSEDDDMQSAQLSFDALKMENNSNTNMSNNNNNDHSVTATRTAALASLKRRSSAGTNTD